MASRVERTAVSEWWLTIDRMLLAALGALRSGRVVVGCPPRVDWRAPVPPENVDAADSADHPAVLLRWRARVSSIHNRLLRLFGALHHLQRTSSICLSL